MTITRVLKQTTIDAIDAELLLCHILHVNRSYIKSYPDHSLTTNEWFRFIYLVRKRKRNVPLAYLTGHKEFFGLDFFVNKYTLVPRPDTELLVELAISHITKHILQDTAITLIDIGTGSGCIPISILSTIQSQAPNSKIKCYASDISKKAIRTAKQNATQHHVNITFKQGSLFNPWISDLSQDLDPTIHVIITANLPYITEEQWKNEPSIQKEPKSALVAKEGGLALYRELLTQITSINMESPITLFFEIDPEQKRYIPSLIRNYIPDADITIHEDLQGHARIVLVKT